MYNLLDSPDQTLLVINLHLAFICACFGGILQTFKKCQTLSQIFESLYIWKVLPKGHILDTAEFYDNTIENPQVHFTLNEDLPINQPSPIMTTSQQPPPPAISFTAPPPPTSVPIAPDTMSTHHDKIKVNKPELFNGD